MKRKRKNTYLVKKISLILLILLAFGNFAIAQNVGINQLSPHPSAMLDITATDMGLLIPRVALDDVNTSAPVTAPAEGLLIYNATGTEAHGFYFWNGTMWTMLGANGYNTSLVLNGTTLELTDNGGTLTADLSSLQDGTGTDDQNIMGSGLAGTILTIGIENGTSQNIDLASLQDGTGTDDQNILGSGLAGNILTIGIEGGTSETVDLSSFGNDWKLTGNTATAADYIGTNNAIDFRLFTNGLERMTIESNGYVGIGTNAPTHQLQVQTTGGISSAKIGYSSTYRDNKLYFGDGSYVWIGEPNIDDRLQLHSSTLTIEIGGSVGTNGQILTSNGTTASWQAPPVQPVVYSETTTPYGSDNTRKTITITTTSATDKVLLLGEFDFAKDASQSYVSLGIWRGGTEIAETSILATASADNTCFVQWVDVPGVGTFTYTIQDRAGAGGYDIVYGSMLTAVVYK